MDEVARVVLALEEHDVAEEVMHFLDRSGKARVVATGGQASLVAGLTNVIETTDPLLTLEGLRLIYAQNSDGGART